MLVDQPEDLTPTPAAGRHKLLPWINLVLTILLIGIGVWYLATKVSLVEIGRALAVANFGYIGLGLLVMMATVLLKAWRWQWLLAATDRSPPFIPLFWATMLGQYVNLIVPFLRLGEIARIYALNRQTGYSKARALGTLVVEKTLELITFALTVAVVLPFVILPDFVSAPGILIGIVPLAALVALYILAYQTGQVIRLLRHVADRLPLRIGKRLLQLSAAGLQGLAALRSQRLTLALLTSSVVIGLLAAVLPYVLFPAFGLPFGLLQGALMHIVVSIASAPPSTPAKIGVFNGAVALLLLHLGIGDEAILISYGIVFHLVVMVPQILLGSIAASRTQWRWRQMTATQTSA